MIFSQRPKNVASNTLYLTAAYVAQKVFSFAFFIFAARLLSVGEIGQYVFALSFTTIFGVFIDFGLSSVLTREAAKEPELSNKYLDGILSFKVVAGVVVYAITMLAAYLLGKDALIREFIAIAGLIMVCDSFSLTLYAAFRAKQNLWYEAVGMVLTQVVIFSAGLTALFFHLSLHYIVGAILLGSIFSLGYSFILARKKLHWRWQWRTDKTLVKKLFFLALPFALAGIFSRVYGYLDTVALSVLAGDEAVGWYAASYKITFALQFIPAAFAAALFPAMSAAFATDKNRVASLFEKSTYYLLLISLPISFGTIFLARDFLALIYNPAYATTALGLQILMASLIFNFLSFPATTALSAGHRQTQNTINMGLTMVVNALANFILIPLFGDQAYLGAASAALLGGLTLFVLSLYYAGRLIDYRRSNLLISSAKILLSGLLMIGGLYFLQDYLSIWLLVPSAGLIYIVSLLAFKAVDTRELKKVFKNEQDIISNY